MIRNLDARMITMLNRVAQGWRQDLLSSGRVDVNYLKPYIEKAYEAIGMPPPKRIIRMPSPMSCIYAMPAIQAQDDDNQLTFFQQVKEQLLIHLRSQIPVDEAYFPCTIELSLNHRIESAMNHSATKHLRSYINTDVFYDSVYAKMAENKRIVDVRQVLFDYLRRSLRHNAASQNIYPPNQTIEFAANEFLLEVLGEITISPRSLCKIMRGSYCYWFKQNYCVLCDKPVLKLDARDRPHCEDGPAVAFEDGLKFYYWEGVHVSDSVILSPQTQTIQEIRDEPNVEARRIRIERLGWLNYLRMTNAATIDERKNEIEGTNEALMRSPDENVLVCACPSTGRVYALQVPNAIRTCEQAQNWLSGGLNERITAAT